MNKQIGKTLIILIIISPLALCFKVNAQDTLFKHNGEIIVAKIYKVGDQDIYYRKLTELDKAVATMQKSEVKEIHFRDGKIEIMKQLIEPSAGTIPGPEMFRKGQLDAVRYYNGYKSPATVTLVTSLLSPLIAVVPAVLFNVTKPRVQNLSYPSQELYNNSDYQRGYYSAAREKRNKRVWRNWGIGLGVNVGLIALLIFASK